MAMTFPVSPTNGQTFTAPNGVVYVWSAASTSWQTQFQRSNAVRQTFTAIANQTVFVVTGGYAPGMIDVYLAGVKLVNGVSVNVSSGVNVVLTTGATAGQIVDVIGLSEYNITNPASATQLGGVLAALAPTGQVMNGISTAGAPTFAADAVGFRNRIINGDMRVAQRGTSFSGVSGYTLDRWGVWCSGTSVNAAQVVGPAGYKYSLQVTGVAGNTIATIQQRIESLNIADLIGQSVTISAVLASSSAQSVTWGLAYASVTDNFATIPVIASGTWSVGTTSATFTATVSNLPAAAANGLLLYIQPNNGGAFTSGTITVTGVQLELGSVATPFEVRPIGVELALCQRYYEAVTDAVLYASSYTSGNSTNWPIASVSFKTTKRASPSITLSSVTYANCTFASTEAIGINGFSIGVNTSPGGSYINFLYSASSEL